MPTPPFPHQIGFLGGGQLARMSIQAAQRMGLSCLSLDPTQNSPASQIAPSVQGKLDDPEALAQIIGVSQSVTLENEFIPANSLRQAFELAQRDPSCLLPGVDTLATIQDKLLQRQAYAQHGAPTPKAVPIDPANPAKAQAEIGLPCVLKARFGGYDGKGTRYAKSPEEFESHRELWSNGNWMAEEFVPFERELAVMVCRSKAQTTCFPVMETIQSKHVCDLVFPADIYSKALHNAQQAAIAAVESVQGYGLFGVELFELPSGEVLINEIAPRPHNSGHYTLDWGGISQFDAHVRLCLGVPAPELTGHPVCMANLLGQPNAGDVNLAIVKTLNSHPEARIHWYGKAESRPGRKMGHLNVPGPDNKDRAVAGRNTFYQAWTDQT